MKHGGIAQYGNLSIWAILVAQTEGVVDDFRKVWVRCRLAVAGKSKHIGQYARRDIRRLLQMNGRGAHRLL